jgi:hypothetical protein
VDLYTILANIPFRVYLTTTPDALLERALTACGRPPQVRSFEWWSDTPRPTPKIKRLAEPNEADGEPHTAVGRPLRKEPLLYKLFGNLDRTETLVITEDHHFDYLVAMSRAMSAKGAVLEDVRVALSDSAVLFLGFRITDWDFRVLLRSVWQLLAAQSRNRYTNVAVQIDPGGDRVADVGLARRYLERFLGRATDVSIYWGTAEQFLLELAERFAKYQANQ